MRSRYASSFALGLALAFVSTPLYAQPAPTSAPAAPAPAGPVPAQAPAAPVAAQPAPAPAAPAPVVGPAAVAAPAGAPPPAWLPPPVIVPAPAPARHAGRVHRAPLPPPPKPKRRYGNAGAPFAFGMGADLRYRSDSGYEKLDAKGHQTELDLFASYDVFQPVRRIVLAAGLSYRHGELGNEDTLGIKSHAVQADLIARYTLTRWLFPQLRAGVGALFSRADLTDDAGDFKAHDQSAGVTGSIGGGVMLQTPRRLFETYSGHLASLSLGFLVEGGYVFASPASYQLKVDADSDLASSAIALGKLDQGGAYLRLMGVLRF